MPYLLVIAYNISLTAEFGITEQQQIDIMALVFKEPVAATMEEIQALIGTFIPEVLEYEVINNFYINKVSVDERPFPVV